MKPTNLLTKILGYLAIVVCSCLLLLGGWHQTATSRPSQARTRAVKLVKVTGDVKHPDQLKMFSPDKTYHPGDLVVKDHHIYRVQARPYGGG